MAKLKGVLKITGKLGGLSFYEMNGEIIVGNPGGLTEKQYGMMKNM